MRKIMMAAALAGSLAFSAPATAQVQGGLINVSLSNILNNTDLRIRLQNILSHNNVSVQIPANVSVPIGLAANICGTTVAVLSAANSTGTCTASTDISQGHMRALANAIQKNR
ncbi:hypothetical protein [Sphingomonas sp.]|uniref:hypothetical protein n=1 Tax=Sphingomonas sp. TaxID=28214 RepID=UPI00183B9D87|nr:hypothetical protein [Sphingomonas sp.]MBA3512167.1 hypothetical protein [Sphingomonas sp.]